MFGHQASHFLKALLPVSLHNELKSTNSDEEANFAIRETFAYIESKLVNEVKIDTKYSGSTSCSVIICPERVVTINLGDSRAVMGCLKKGKWKAEPLTEDHKPDTPEEKKRILSKQGRVFPFKDDEGQFVGPYRVWIKEHDVPGLAMSRSFGDEVAASVGVISEPEIKVRKFKEEDKFLIVASDGVWEFVTNSEVIELIGKYYDTRDAKGAAEELLYVTREKWIQEEDSVDDTTMIIVFF